jgi:signal transduction histidine kinase
MRYVSRLDPRSSLAAGIIWLVVGLAASFAAAASFGVGRVARDIVVQQHVRRLALETEQLGSDLEQAVDARLRALRELRDLDPAALTRSGFERLSARYPGLGWIAVIDDAGIVVAGDGTLAAGSRVDGEPWFARGRAGPWIGLIGDDSSHAATPLLGDLAAPLTDSDGRTAGVVVARLSWHWATRDVRRLSVALDPQGSAQTWVLDPAGTVTVGEPSLRNRPWRGVALPAPSADESAAADGHAGPRFERLPDGSVALVARAAVQVGGDDSSGGWQVQLSEPEAEVNRRANELGTRILWISACLGAATAVLGALGARHLTGRLQQLTLSAAAVGRKESQRIDVPPGRDEVAQLGAAFAAILDDLRAERGELLALSAELERRVAARTREVERLAAESRYAAVVRERLKIARDLHDTLAHSMMAMLSEVRLLRRLHGHDPAGLAEELARAEEVARDGLNEARTAITQMRLNAVRDTGLGSALARLVERFLERTGIPGEFRTDRDAARFGDERGEVMFRMAEEALRNVERHAMATHVTVELALEEGAEIRLRIIDDGVGFDTDAAYPAHFGLVGLREQADLIGASLAIDSVRGRGTVVTVMLKIEPELS